MAIEGKDNQTKNTGAGTSSNNQMGNAFASAREQAGQAGGGFGGSDKQEDGGMWSFLNPAANGLFTVADTAAGETLSKLDKALTEIYKTANAAVKITLVPLSMEQNQQLNIDTLVVCTELTNNPKLGIAYHPLLLAGSIPKIEPVTIQVNGQNVEELRVDSDVYDAVFQQAIHDEVIKAVGHNNVTPTLGEVIPRGFNLEDDDAVQKVARNASMAGAVELQKKMGVGSLNLARVKDDATLTLRSTFGQPNELDRVGLPVRSDIIVSLTAEPIAKQGQNKSVVQTRSSQVSRLNCFVDLVWAPTMAPQNPFFAQQQQPAFGQVAAAAQPYQKYVPRIVVTSMSTQNPPTPEVQLLSALLSMNVSENGNWVHAFEPRNYKSGSKELNLRDIGVMAIEANFENDPSGLGKPVDTSLETFQPMLASYLAAIIRPEPIISIDVNECGPDSWFNGLFAMAAEEQQGALDELFNAANTLTNGRFAANWAAAQYNGPVLVHEDNRIHMGYYLDGEGQRRDIREIDYLAVLNRFGGTEHEVVKMWSDSFLSGTAPLAKRLEDRKRIIDKMTNNTAVYTGFARRVSFAHKLLEIMGKSAKEAGLDFRTVYSQAALKSSERASGNFDNLLFSGNASSGLFNRTSFGATNQNFGGNRSFGFGRI